jgi:hypothetical protein
MDPRFFRQYLDILNEGPPPGIGPNASIKSTTPAPVNVPQGWEAKTQADGSTRVSKIGSMSREQYKKNMADYAAKYDSPEYMKYHQDKMASGGFSDEEKLANYKEQEKYFGRGDPAILDTLKQQPAQKPSVGNGAVFEVNEGPAAGPAAKQVPQGSMSNMPGAKAYSDAADPMAATNAQYQQNMQNIQGEKDKRFQDHMAARDAATQKYGSVTKALSSGEVDALGPSGDPLQRSSVLTTDLKQKERQAGQEYTAANREKTGGGHWQYDKKTVDSEMGPITQTTATRIATPTKGEVIRQGLQGGGSLYNRHSGLADPNQPAAPQVNQLTKGLAPSQLPVQEDELVRLRELLKR